MDKIKELIEKCRPRCHECIHSNKFYYDDNSEGTNLQCNGEGKYKFVDKNHFCSNGKFIVFHDGNFNILDHDSLLIQRMNGEWK